MLLVSGAVGAVVVAAILIWAVRKASRQRPD
jgi:hypothetical protein